MKWNRKGILICAIVFLGLFGFLIGRALFPGPQERQQASFASEENVVFPTIGSGAALEEADEEASPTPKEERARKEKKPTIKPTATATVTAASQENPKKKTKETPKAKKKKKTAEESKVTVKPTVQPTAIMTAAPTITTQEKANVSFTIQCTAIMGRQELWKEGIEEILPSSGYFYQGQQEISEGETVYDVLKRICKEKNIALDAEFTPIYGTYYIKGIGNLYEFDCGSESGWKYKVNGVLPNVGCSGYSLKKGDQVVFYYDYQY